LQAIKQLLNSDAVASNRGAEIIIRMNLEFHRTLYCGAVHRDARDGRDRLVQISRRCARIYAAATGTEPPHFHKLIIIAAGAGMKTGCVCGAYGCDARLADAVS